MKIKKILTYTIPTALMLLPFLVLAQPEIVPTTCDGPDCDFGDLAQLGQNIINFLLWFGLVVASCLFAYAGFLMITAGGDEGKIKRAKGIFWNVGIGLIWALCAWLIVSLITNALLGEGFFKDGGLL